MAAMTEATPRETQPHPTTFIVRVSLDGTGELIGIVERAATGLKVRVHGVAEIGRVIEEAFRPSRGTRMP
jgi:hypothetical protein